MGSLQLEPFIKAAEIWVPAPDRLVLVHGGGYYRNLDDFKATSRSMQFAYDQGLPGRTWAARRPVVMTDVEDDYFQRKDAAIDANIRCAISLPVFCGEFLHAVIVLFCGGGETEVGALELWHNGNGSDTELTLVDGYYGVLAKFEWISRRLTIMRGRGLPGSAWYLERPVIFENLGESGSFLRASHAAEVGITTGLAIPFIYSPKEVQVLTILSAKGTPIARRFEIWTPEASGQSLRFDSGQCSSEQDLLELYADTAIRRGEGPLGECWLSGRPLVMESESDPGETQLLIPLIRFGRLNAVIVLAF